MKLNYWKIGFITNGLIPFGFVISLMTFYIHASRILGRFPTYNQPDPKELDIYYHYDWIIRSCGNIWVYSIPILIIMFIVYWVIKRKRTNWRLIGLCLTGHLIAIVLFISGIMEWFAD